MHENMGVLNVNANVSLDPRQIFYTFHLSASEISKSCEIVKIPRDNKERLGKRVGKINRISAGKMKGSEGVESLMMNILKKCTIRISRITYKFAKALNMKESDDARHCVPCDMCMYMGVNIPT